MELSIYNQKYILVKDVTKRDMNILRENCTAKRYGFRNGEHVELKAVAHIYKLNRNGNRIILIPSGLWRRFHKLGYKIKGINKLRVEGYNKDEFNDYIDNLKLPFTPRTYQRKQARINCTMTGTVNSIGTSGGKTFITYLSLMYIKNVLHKKKGIKTRILVIVPSISLVGQFHDDFYEYQGQEKIFIPPYKTPRMKSETSATMEWVGNKTDKWQKRPLKHGIISESELDSHMIKWDEMDLKVFKIHNNAYNLINIDEADIVVSTYQSLAKLPPNWFLQFNTMFVDEVHTLDANSIKYAVKCCKNVTQRFGMTGSFPDPKSAEMLNIESYIGAFINEHKVHTMRDDGDVADFSIQKHKIVHKHEDTKDFIKSLMEWDGKAKAQKYGIDTPPPSIFKDKGKLMLEEQKYLFSNKKRIDLLAKLVCNEPMNTLLLTKRVGSAVEIYKACKEYCKIHHPHKKVWLINGSVGLDDRNDILDQCKIDFENNIIIASIKCIGTGLSLKPLFSGWMVGCGKAKQSTIQAIGRWIRKHPDKKHVVINDLGDYLQTNEPMAKNHYLKYGSYDAKHQAARMHVYKGEKYKVRPDVITHTLS